MSAKVTADRLIELLPFERKRKDIFKRRFNKLKNDPVGFIEGSVNKRSAQLRERIPIKYKSNHDFTVVSAVYNVEKYLNDYFLSLVNQSVSFKKHIKLIIVDDGSTDGSADIIRKWQQKYPKNIIYMFKENGGQASARNLGLQYVDTEWVTFIDPDDYVSSDYFREVDSALGDQHKVSMIVSNIKFYIEEQDLVKNSHPLRYRFKQTVNKVKNNSLEKNINLSSAASFFKKDFLEENNILFNEDVKPNFEDGKLIADYLLASYDCETLFLKEAVYFYRKREDSTSTLDSSWRMKEKYDDVLRFGFIDILERYYKELGYIPHNIQNTVLYDLYWYKSYLMNKPERLNFLTDKERERYYQLYRDIFSYIDPEIIMKFNIAGVWFFDKVGMLGAFKGQKPPFQISYIENIDLNKKQILISTFSYFDLPISFRINDDEAIPSFGKAINNDFNGDIFVKEYRYWINYSSDSDFLQIKIGNNQKSRISVNGNHYNNGIQINELISKFFGIRNYGSNGTWLLMDRETNADDNAEHFYRYLMRNQPQQKCIFALNRDSKDWDRLENEGFELVEFGSKLFENYLKNCSKIVSSHLESHINNYFGDNYKFSKKFVFLQHGVIKDDLSEWINTKKLLNCFITSTVPEYESIVSSESKYRLTNKEVVLTGLPRHDSLIKRQSTKKEDGIDNILLIMPTWRHYIVGNVIGKGANQRTKNKQFMDSSYARHWHAFLNSKKLEQLCVEYNYKVIFAPHNNITPYLNDFNIPDYISVWDANDSNESMQDIFLKSKLLITDYSSVTFDMGLLLKPTLYYQFDKEEFFSGIHTYQQGYFSYEENGFGPVVTEENALLIELENILANDGDPLEPYLTRMQETFAYRDTNNCKRVYEAILDLDRPDTSVTSVEKIIEYAEKAITHEAWDLALERIENALQHSDITQAQVKEITQIKESVLQTGYQNKPVKLSNILWQEGRVEEALDVLKQIDDIEASEELLRLRVKLAILNNDFVLARDSQKLLLENYNEQCTTEDWQFYTQLASI